MQANEIKNLILQSQKINIAALAVIDNELQMQLFTIAAEVYLAASRLEENKKELIKMIDETLCL